MKIASLAFLALFFFSTNCVAAEIRLYGAGSLREAMTEMAEQFHKATGDTVEVSFGHSGKMREKAEQPGTADIFTSADMGHAQKLQKDGRATFVAEFARNSLCLIGTPATGINDGNVLEKMLDPALTLGVFPPIEDPCGDYTVEMFKRANALISDAESRLMGKAVTIKPDMVRGKIAEGENYTLALLRESTIDLHVGYCSGARMRLQAAYPELLVAELPQELRVGANYGLTVLKDAKPEAYKMALFILSQKGQGILKKFGFTPVGMTD